MTIKELIQNVDDLKVHLNEISVYDLDVHTSMDLYYTIAKKFNVVIKELSRFEGIVSDEVIKQNEKLVYLLGEGLNTEVVNKINNMVADGTMDTIINHNVFTNLNNKVENYKEELSSQIKEVVYITNNYVNIKQFKTDTITWDKALELTFNFCLTNKIKKIVLPNEQMIFYENHVIENKRELWDLEIEGVGQSIDGHGSEIKFLGTGLFLDVNFSEPSIGFWRGIKFKNISFVGNNKSNNLLRLVYNQQSTFENCMFQNCKNSVILTGNSHYIKFLNCRFMNNECGIFSPSERQDYFINGEANCCYIDNCFFTYCKNPIKQMGDCSSWLVVNTDFEGYNETIILNSNNTFNNVRIERNIMGVFLELNSYNNIHCDIHGSGGGLACNPGIKINGSNNNLRVKGNGYKLLELSSNDLYNNINITNWECLESYTVLDKISNNTNISSFKQPLLNINLSDFISNGGINYNSDTQNIVKSDNGKLYRYITSNTGYLYVTLNQKAIAGSGYKLTCNGKSVDILSTFPKPTDNTKTIYQFKTIKGAVNELAFEIDGDNGSAVNITNFKISEYLSEYLFD